MNARAALLLVTCAAVSECGATAYGACTVSNSLLAFGNYNPVSGSPTLSNGSITVTCGALVSTTITVPFTVLLSAGNSGSTANRALSSGAATLAYNIYTSSSYLMVWDNATGVSGGVTIVGLLGTPVLTYGSTTLTAYGLIGASQAIPVGSYADALTVTVNF